MTTFLQLHLLTSYPPANLNRDDLGRPKQAQMGGVNRIRVSSQSLKRAWRTGPVFEEALANALGERTKRLGIEAFKRMVAADMAEQKATKAAQAIAGVFGKLKSEKGADKEALEHLEIETLAHIAPEERAAVEALCDQLATDDREPKAEELDLLRHDIAAADIALFGRMLAARPDHNIDAACQVGHAITVHKAVAEDDFFTAVDDLNEGIEDVGAGHMGETEFGAGLFYLYICVDRHSLLDNLGGDEQLAKRTLAALVEAAVKVPPTGKQNSFASRAYASFALCETGDQQPRSLSVAFLQPVRGTNLIEDGVNRLLDTREKMNQVYGDCADHVCEFNADTGTGSLADVIACATR